MLGGKLLDEASRAGATKEKSEKYIARSVSVKWVKKRRTRYGFCFLPGNSLKGCKKVDVCSDLGACAPYGFVFH
jgi:hypothetical protein